MNHLLSDCTVVFRNAYTALYLRLEGGQLFCEAAENRITGYRWENPGRRVPLIVIPGFSFSGSSVTMEETTDNRGGLSAAGNEMRFAFEKDGRTVFVTLRSYADNPFIRVSAALDGVFGRHAETAAAAAETGIETAVKAPAKAENDATFACPLSEKHLKVRTVTLRDVTDANNILVSESAATVYPVRPLETRGQLFFVEAYLAGETMMLAKEAPSCGARIAESPYDLRVEPAAGLRMSGFGADLSREAAYTPEVPLYAVSFAVGAAEELERAWRAYYRRDIAALTSSGLVGMSNTWGDRNQDAAVCESFMLGEIERAKTLGVTAVQIDDGWQSGVTANSKLAKGSAWGSGYYAVDPDFWVPHPAKFPRGLTPVQEAADAAGVKLGLWFSPDLANDYAMWEKDAEVLLGLHRQYGVRFFKLDGIDLLSKTAETRLLAMIRRVHTESAGAVSFNMDITAQHRWGYLTHREFGNLFVENRYTDWGNYHPHSTLRTVWMLSRYIPTAKLQMEFLNLRRNPQKYEGDPLAPQLYPIDWAFASVMFANPLYWMEMTHLSDEDAEALGKIAAVWREIRFELAGADVTPVGGEPDGIAFTGLRADCGNHGYLVLFRENSPEAEHRFTIPALAGKTLTKLAGTADAAPAEDGAVFTAPTVRSYVLVRYE